MKCKKLIMQGDSYFIDFKITSNNEEIDLTYVDRIQFVIGDLVKYYEFDDSGEIKYKDGVFKFPLSQAESLEMSGPQEVQVRVKTIDDRVIGKIYGIINLMFSSNKEEI